ncbi:S41 family peptidase [uncultured Desulfobulbus sp.]|uniref:S41 family peptidase n=1 Tax=uncultured Desulfobulbus sp. TaxID=239745 RepID=UPI0029C7B7F5|nr:S41 family peptidase [uncultured Desulfobulbus sp.]
MLVLSVCGWTIDAVCSQPPPLAEIRTLIAQKALNPPSEQSLSQLNMEQLNERLHALDSHARYLPLAAVPQPAASSPRIGLNIFAYKARIWVTPEPGGPASLQGVPEIGELREVNGTPVAGDVQQTSALIDRAIREGKVVVRISDGKVKRYTILPSSAKLGSTTTREAGNATFIQISDFVSHETAPFFASLYTTLHRSGATLVLDLRGCAGGDLFEALEIAGLFVPTGFPLISTYDRTGKIHAYSSPAGTKLPRPSGILMDSRTASAAEVLAGIFKSYTLAPLIGERTYGKCESQTVFKLSDGGELWLTTLAIHFADDSTCTQVGVQPDIPYPDISIAKVAAIKERLPFAQRK